MQPQKVTRLFNLKQSSKLTHFHKLKLKQIFIFVQRKHDKEFHHNDIAKALRQNWSKMTFYHHSASVSNIMSNEFTYIMRSGRNKRCYQHYGTNKIWYISLRGLHQDKGWSFCESGTETEDVFETESEIFLAGFITQYVVNEIQ